MKLLITAIICSLTIASSFSYSDGRMETEVELAIQHFNADHSKPLTLWSDEHRFMNNLMRKIGEQYPKFGKIIMREALLKKYNSLVFDKYVSKGDIDISVDSMLAEASALGYGCPLFETTTLSKTDVYKNDPARTDKKVDRRYELNVNSKFSGNRKLCKNVLAKELKDLGIQSIQTVTDLRSFGNSYQVSLQYGHQIQDMQYHLNLLKKRPEFTTLAQYLTVKPTEFMIGDGSSVSLKDSTGKASFSDPVVLVFDIGSGDCPAGCINHEYTTIKATPVNNGADFKLEILSVTGKGNFPTIK